MVGSRCSWATSWFCSAEAIALRLWLLALNAAIAAGSSASITALVLSRAALLALRPLSSQR